jgi:hypothetical protein
MTVIHAHQLEKKIASPNMSSGPNQSRTESQLNRQKSTASVGTEHPQEKKKTRMEQTGGPDRWLVATPIRSGGDGSAEAQSGGR